jgi:glycosyltransferase involved in cell wall biosynthesis
MRSGNVALSSPLRIMILHRNLGFGGAEMLITAAATGLKKRGHELLVATFYDNNPLGQQLTEAGVPLECLYKRGRWDVVLFGQKLLDLVRRFQPRILYTVLPDPNLIAITARLAKPDLKLVWGISVAYLDLRPYDFVTRMSYKLEAKMARFADLIISNSDAGIEDAVKRGIPRAKMRLVPNGVDTAKYCPDQLARVRVRAEWGIADHERLIGLIGRLDPQKDIPSFLKAASIVAAAEKGIRFVVVGDGPADYRASLIARCEQLGILGQTLWIPARPEVADVYNALDLMVISAGAEGTSYALVQAMACGKSAVVTEAGDNGLAVGEWGQVTPPHNPEALADAIRRQLTRLAIDSESIAAGCRRHAHENFSIEAFAAKTEALMLSVAGNGH